MTDEKNTTPQAPVPPAASDAAETAPVSPVAPAAAETAPLPPTGAPDAAPTATYAAPATPGAPAAPAAPAVNNGKATGALVCGILAFLLSPSIVFGIVLGIVAIVLAVQAKKISKDGKSTAGTVLGVLGIISAVLMLVFGVLLGAMSVAVYQDPEFQKALQDADTYSSSSTTGTTTGSSSSSAVAENDDEQAVIDAVEAYMDKNFDTSDANKQVLMESMSGLSEMGMDTDKVASWVFEGMEYTISDVAVSGDTATAFVELKMHDLDGFQKNWENKISSANIPAEASQEDMLKMLFQYADEAMAETGYINEDYPVTLTKTNGTWTVDAISEDDALAALAAA